MWLPVEIKLIKFLPLDILFKKTDVLVDSFVKLSSALDFRAAKARTGVG